MEYWLGALLGVVVGGFAWKIGFDRDRAFYPTVLIVIASYYSLFAIMGETRSAVLLVEITFGFWFLVLAVMGFRTSMWLIAAGIAAHGLFDFFVHPHLPTNNGMPVWWPGFCGSIDLVIGGWLAAQLWTRRRVLG